MKICMFHLMPYRDLPADFERRYNSAYIDPLWFNVADSEKVGQYYNATLDEMLYAAKAGLHGLCTNQHHQKAARTVGLNVVRLEIRRAQDIAPAFETP